jgi:hypothetical protein
MMNIDPEDACSVTAHTARIVRRRSTGFLIISRGPIPELSSFSRSMAALISKASASTSVPAGRSQRRDSTPSSYRPWRMSHLGDSGIKNMQTIRMVGTT